MSEVWWEVATGFSACMACISLVVLVAGWNDVSRSAGIMLVAVFAGLAFWASGVGKSAPRDAGWISRGEAVIDGTVTYGPILGSVTFAESESTTPVVTLREIMPREEPELWVAPEPTTSTLSLGEASKVWQFESVYLTVRPGGTVTITIKVEGE